MRIVCDSCDAKLKVSDKLVGRTIKCPKCGQAIVAEQETEPDGSDDEPESPKYRALKIVGTIVVVTLVAVGTFVRRNPSNATPVKEVSVGSLKVTYLEPVTEAEATRAGQHVFNVLQTQNAVGMHITRADNRFTLSFSLKPQVKVNEELTDDLAQMAFEMSKKVLPEAIEIRLSDSSGKLVSIIPAREVFRTRKAGKVEVVYRTSTPDDEARRFADFAASTFTREETLIRLDKLPDIYRIQIPTSDTTPLKEEEIADASQLCRRMSKELFSGMPIEIHYCDHRWTPFAVVTAMGLKK